MEQINWLHDITALGMLGAVLYGLYRLVSGFLLGEGGVKESYRRYVEASEKAAAASAKLGDHVERNDIAQRESCDRHAVLLGGVATDIQRQRVDIQEHLRVAKVAGEQVKEMHDDYGDGAHVRQCKDMGDAVDVVAAAMVEACERVKAYAAKHHPESSVEVSGHCDSIVSILKK